MKTRPCEAHVNLGDSETAYVTLCGAPVPRDACPFPERVFFGACEARQEAAVSLGDGPTEGKQTAESALEDG